MYVRGRGLGTDLGGEVIDLDLPHCDAAHLRVGEFDVRHVPAAPSAPASRGGIRPNP